MSLSLRSLSDHEVLSRVTELTRRERSLTLHVLLHLNEIERRLLHLKLGCASMFDYCTSRLGYSASAASRRIRTARCVARFPEVFALLETNDVNLSTISQASRVLTPDNKDELLARLVGKSQREVEAIVAEYEPLAAMPHDRVRSVVVRVPLATLLSPTATPTPALPTVSVGRAPAPAGDHTRSGRDLDSRDERPVRTQAAATMERRKQIAFCASEDFTAKLAKFQSLMCFRLPPNPSLEQIFALALDYVLDKEDPEKRGERRAQRSSHRTTRTDSKPPRQPRPDPRRIPVRVRDEVFVRDKGRCTYAGADGRRCGSTHALQVDHIQPVARGGAGGAGNLRLLCARHNRIEAERILGDVARRSRDLHIYNRYGRARTATDSSPKPTAPGSSCTRQSRPPS
jgi:5-methylcytosine-specific restriction endonuclease McrA